MLLGKRCVGCGAAETSMLLDFGIQPPSNRFIPTGALDSDAHPLSVGQCSACGLLQLLDPMLPAMVKARHSWLTYNEPEGHLDALVKNLTALPSVTQHSRIIGLTYKDQSTLARFNKLGYGNTFLYDPKNDFGINDACAGLETIQSLADESMAETLINKHGKADVLLVRHVLEHAHAPQHFLDFLGRLVTPGGYIVLEMPDCRKFVDARDYNFLWEEHITYFSPYTLDRFLQRKGFAVQSMLVYSYPLEDSLVAVAQVSKKAVSSKLFAEVTTELVRGIEFASGFQSLRTKYHSHFQALRKDGKRIAIFGAGHLAVKFLNLYELEEYVQAVIDDNPHKQGLVMPGSRVPIVGSSELSKIDLCMLSLNPESEQKVLAKQEAYLKGGGQFASIFALSPLALKLQ